MVDITIYEAIDYVAAVDCDGFTLTPSGVEAARTILETRADWTPSHFLMLNRLNSGVAKVPLKLLRLVAHTRLGDALAMARDFNRKHIKNQKKNLRRRAARATAMAA